MAGERRPDDLEDVAAACGPVSPQSMVEQRARAEKQCGMSIFFRSPRCAGSGKPILHRLVGGAQGNPGGR